MKRFGFFILLASLLCGAGSVSAQNAAGGLLLDRDIMTPADFYELTQPGFTFGTARSMAMAGAFVSLGADFASLGINPAGLGMYRRSELTLTPMMSFERSHNDAPGFYPNRKNRFSLGNFGFTTSVYEGSGALVGVNIGLGYNRVQDLNYQYSFYTQGNAGSLADVFSDMLQWGGFGVGDVTGDVAWKGIDPRFWGAVIGYKVGMTDQTGDGWRPTWIGNGADIGNYATVVSSGSVGEYEFSAGMNIANKLYLGATLGVQSLQQTKTYYYGEDYVYGGDGVDPELDYQLRYANFNQEVRLDGAGVNLKLGLVWRPVQNLRLGVAFHTPTYYWIDRSYVAYADSEVRVNNPADPEGLNPGPDGLKRAQAATAVLEDTGDYDWEFASPSRLMFGLSYAFGNRGVISVDYERTWYDGMRMKHNPAGGGNGIYNETFRAWYKAANILRVGAEFKPLPWLAVRAGFGYAGSALRDGKMLASAPMARRTLYGSAGAGLLLGRSVTLDLAYGCTSTEHTDYELYYAQSAAGLNSSGAYNTRIVRHTAALTLGIRF
ncbi:MAG: outer membrane protein transport protein [Alistipes sp.]|nr:outer membrane protein transport protein [Alistipes sp.]